VTAEGHKAYSLICSYGEAHSKRIELDPW